MGFTTLVTLVLFLGGVQLVSIGLHRRIPGAHLRRSEGTSALHCLGDVSPIGKPELRYPLPPAAEGLSQDQ